VIITINNNFIYLVLPAATNLGAVARGKEGANVPASLIVDDERRINELTVDTLDGYPDLLIWLLVVLEVRLDGLFTEPIFVLLV
jgi:hypothetical protein